MTSPHQVASLLESKRVFKGWRGYGQSSHGALAGIVRQMSDPTDTLGPAKWIGVSKLGET
jgi:hypothetical protein